MNVIISNKYKDMLNNLNIDVIKSLEGEFTVDEIVASFTNFFFQRMILDITAIKDYNDLKNIQKLSVSLDKDKIILLLDEADENTSSQYLSRLISLGFYNFTRNKEGILYLLEHPNTYKDVAHIHQLETLTEEVVERVVTQHIRVLGIKNLTEHAGATTLIYILKKQLESIYSVVAIEVDKRDFAFFNDKDMISTTRSELPKVMIKNNDKDLILLDLNGYDGDDVSNEILYLVEPSMIKLNKLMMVNSNCFASYSSKKIVLNKSLLTSRDVLDFESEARVKIFYNMPPLDERKKNDVLVNPLLAKLGFIKPMSKSKAEGKILGLFRG